MECTAPLAQAVLPSGCSNSGPVVIDGIELLDVELNSTLTPIEGAPAPQGSDHRKPHTEPYTERQRETGAEFGWRNINWRVVRIRPRAVDRRAVNRRIDEFGIGRLDNDALAFGRYLLLSVGTQRPRGRGLVAKTLDRVHDVCLVPRRRCPAALSSRALRPSSAVFEEKAPATGRWDPMPLSRWRRQVGLPASSHARDPAATDPL
jgi:hypothetical protein